MLCIFVKFILKRCGDKFLYLFFNFVAAVHFYFNLFFIFLCNTWLPKMFQIKLYLFLCFSNFGLWPSNNFVYFFFNKSIVIFLYFIICCMILQFFFVSYFLAEIIWNSNLKSLIVHPIVAIVMHTFWQQHTACNSTNEDIKKWILNI